MIHIKQVLPGFVFVPSLDGLLYTDGVDYQCLYRGALGIVYEVNDTPNRCDMRHTGSLPTAFFETPTQLC